MTATLWHFGRWLRRWILPRVTESVVSVQVNLRRHSTVIQGFILDEISDLLCMSPQDTVQKAPLHAIALETPIQCSFHCTSIQTLTRISLGEMGRKEVLAMRGRGLCEDVGI